MVDGTYLYTAWDTEQNGAKGSRVGTPVAVYEKAATMPSAGGSSTGRPTSAPWRNCQRNALSQRLGRLTHFAVSRSSAKRCGHSKWIRAWLCAATSQRASSQCLHLADG